MKSWFKVQKALNIRNDAEPKGGDFQDDIFQGHCAKVMAQRTTSNYEDHPNNGKHFIFLRKYITEL